MLTLANCALLAMLGPNLVFPPLAGSLASEFTAVAHCLLIPYIPSCWALEFP